MSIRHRGGLAGATTLLATVALVASAVPVAADTGTITVQGGSKAKVKLTIPTASQVADFGTDMTPDGDASGETGVVHFVDAVNDPSWGACYQWSGSVEVKSNVQYDLLVTSDTNISQLGFKTSAGTDYATCTNGEAASTAMFPAPTDPAGAWAVNLAKTKEQATNLWLGVDVQWEDDPDANLADTTLTITAQAG